jgi:hypothetical protein
VGDQRNATEGAEAFRDIGDGVGYFWASHYAAHRMPQMRRSRLALVSTTAYIGGAPQVQLIAPPANVVVF